MFLSKRSNGIYFIVYHDEDGSRRKQSTKTKIKSEAIKQLREFKIISRAEAERIQRTKITLCEFSEEYLDYVKSSFHLRTYKIHKLAFNNLLKFLGKDFLLEEITARHMDLLKGELLKTLSPVTTNIRLTKLKRMFNVALRWKVIVSNPLDEIEFAYEPESHPKVISESDFQFLLSRIKNNLLKDCIHFALLTGLRKSELINLRWVDVDLQERVILIFSRPNFKVKAGKKRRIPLSSVAIDILASRREQQDSEYVFSMEGHKLEENWLTRNFKKQIRRAGIDDSLAFKSLRSSFATWLLRKKVGIQPVSKFLGHSRVSTTDQHYSLFIPELLHDEIEKIAVCTKR